MLLTVVFFGWPFQSETISVSEDVTQTVIATIEVPVVVTTWLFFSTTKMELQEVPRQVTETIINTRRGSAFSLLLLVPMGIVEASASALYLSGIQWLWSIRG